MSPEPLYEEDALRIEERETYLANLPPPEPTEDDEPTEVTVEVPQNLSCWRKLQKSMRSLVASSLFETFITLCILFNTLAMAVEYYQMDRTFYNVLDYCNLVSVATYISERKRGKVM